MLEEFLNHKLYIRIERRDKQYLGELHDLLRIEFVSGDTLISEWFSRLLSREGTVSVLCHNDTLYLAPSHLTPTVGIAEFLSDERSVTEIKVEENEIVSLFGE